MTKFKKGNIRENDGEFFESNIGVFLSRINRKVIINYPKIYKKADTS